MCLGTVLTMAMFLVHVQHEFFMNLSGVQKVLESRSSLSLSVPPTPQLRRVTAVPVKNRKAGRSALCRDGFCPRIVSRQG